MLNAPHSSPPVDLPEHVTRILSRHRQFMILSAIAFGGLFAEEAWAATQLWPGSPSGLQFPLGLLIVVVALAGSGLGFLIPPGRVRPEKYVRPVGAFASAMSQGLAITILANGVAYVLLLSLAGFDLEAAYNLLKDVYVYTLVAVLFQALLYYVRHMHWVYDQFGGADSPLKPIAASGGIGLIIFVVVITFLPMDLATINSVSGTMRGVVGLHVYVRDLYLITLALAGYAWHMRWIAEH